MADTVFTIIRHGETEANQHGILQGQYDEPLNETGFRQAERAAERLRSEPFDLFYSSDLSRAWKTAELISRSIGIKPSPAPELREWHLGELEGRPVSELKKRFASVMDAFQNQPCQDIKVPGGESRNDFFLRVQKFMVKLTELHPGKKILLVTHGGAMRAMFDLAVGPVRHGCMIPSTLNASYSKIAYREEGWQLCCWNDVLHLKQVTLRNSITF